MRLRSLSILLPSLVLVAACGQDNSDTASGPGPLGPGSVATVNGESIPESIFRLYSLAAVQKNADELTEDERAKVLADLVQFRVLADAARTSGLLEERTVAAELELQRLQYLARTMAVRHLDENPATEAELRAMYEDNLPRFSNTQYKARHILVDSEAEATDLIAQLDAGGDFPSLARENSTGPTGPQGGDLGWFSADSMVAPFADAVRSMDVGSHSSAPVQTRFGWHVILLEETRDQQAPGLEAVRVEISNLVDRRKLEDYVSSLRDAAEIVIAETAR